MKVSDILCIRLRVDFYARFHLLNMGAGLEILKDGKCLCSKAEEDVEYFFTMPHWMFFPCTVNVLSCVQGDITFH